MCNFYLILFAANIEPLNFICILFKFPSNKYNISRTSTHHSPFDVYNVIQIFVNRNSEPVAWTGSAGRRRHKFSTRRVVLEMWLGSWTVHSALNVKWNVWQEANVISIVMCMKSSRRNALTDMTIITEKKIWGKNGISSVRFRSRYFAQSLQRILRELSQRISHWIWMSRTTCTNANWIIDVLAADNMECARRR